MVEERCLNIVFAGTPEFAARHLQALLTSRHRVQAVYTQPDRPAGRGKTLRPSPVKELALAAGLAVEQPFSLKSAEAQQTLVAFNADILVVVAYGLLLPKTVLETPPLGCINVHASLLPRWRGAAPIQRALEAGDEITGVTIMQMEEGLDTGPMILTRECPIEARDTAEILHDRLLQLGPQALLASLELFCQNSVLATPQVDSLATYARKLTKDEGRIDWRESAALIDRKVRALNPFPVAFCELDGKNMRIYAGFPAKTSHSKPPGTILEAGSNLVVACGENTVFHIERLQLPGKKAMNVDDALRGARGLFAAGTRLGDA